MIGALSALVAALLVALGFVLLTNDDGDAGGGAADVSTTIEAESSVVPEATTDATAAPQPTAAADTTVDSTVAPETTVAPAPETSATAVLEPTPDPTVAPAPNVSPGGIPLATPGFVRILDSEYLIQRTCLSNPFPGYSVTSYLFFDDQGFVEIVERTSDESFQGGSFRGSYEIEDFGDDGFGMFFVEGDSAVPISVNPTGFGDEPCAGSLQVTDSSNPEFPIWGAIVDICFGNYGPDDLLGYRAWMAEGASLTGAANADGTLFMSYQTIDYDFAGDDPAATTNEVAGGFEIRGTAVGNPGGSYAGQSREILASVDDAQVRECTDVD